MNHYSKPLQFLACLVLPYLFVITLKIPHPQAAAAFGTIVILWLTELIPLAATALLAPLLAFLYNIMPLDKAFAGFGSSILFLFLGCFLLAESMQKYGWDRRMAFFVLSSRFSPATPSGLISLVACICFVLSMWISNTATAAVMTPICLGIINSTASHFSSDRQRNIFGSRLLLTCAFSSSIGGLATPVGSPPNLIAIELLAERGISLGFFDWSIIATPLALSMLLIIIVLMHFRYPLESRIITGLREHARQELDALGPLKAQEIQIAVVFFLTILCWITPGLLKALAPDWPFSLIVENKLNMNIVGLCAGLALFILPGEKPGQANMSWQDASKIDWGTILLFGGGLTLGNILNHSGLATTIGHSLFQPSLGMLGLIALGVVFSIITSEFSSNTASASILIPIMLGSLAGSDVSSSQVTALILACVVGASFGFMLPVSTPPNAIVFGTGRLKVSEMIIAGSLFDFLGAVLTILFVYLFLI